MIVFHIRTSVVGLALCATVTACMGVRPQPAPPTSPRTLSTKVMMWKRDAPPMAFPAAARRVQLVITPGWGKNEHVAWVVANGTDVVSVYRLTSTDRVDLIDHALRTLMQENQGIEDHLSWYILGSIKPPPPPPGPGPGGEPGPDVLVSNLPRTYVDSVMQTVWNMNLEGARVEGQALAR